MTDFVYITRIGQCAAVALSALVLAAFTAPEDPARPSASAETTKQESAANAQDRPGKKYCIQSAPTGTRMVQKTCKTKEQWAREGITLDDLTK